MMHRILGGAGLASGMALGVLALGAPAAAQQGGNEYVSGHPVLHTEFRNGSFTGVLDPDTNELCYILNARGLDRPTAAHIHVGGPGETGRPVVTLEAPAGGSSGACLALQADVARSLLANPGGYYVNVHTAAFPGGAVRGQLRG